jgi:hypothetical protein
MLASLRASSSGIFGDHNQVAILFGGDVDLTHRDAWHKQDAALPQAGRRTIRRIEHKSGIVSADVRMDLTNAVDPSSPLCR